MSAERKWLRKRPPAGYEIIEPVMEALEQELKEQVNESHDGKRKVESLWPVHQINWQVSRYVYDMYYKYKRIPKEVFDYCVKNKMVDAGLIAKWKKPGYERLCSTYVINPRNFNFGTVSICRVPRYDLGPDHPVVEDKFCGCRGCATGKGGRRNIFGNKYGQYLAAIQVRREEKAASGDGPPVDEYETVWATTEEEEKLDAAEQAEEEDFDVEPNRKKRRRAKQQSAATAPPEDPLLEVTGGEAKAAGEAGEAGKADGEGGEGN